VRTEVAVPRVLRDWSTVGSTSASVVWRCNSNVQNVDAFLLYYRPLCHTEKRWRPPPSLDPAHLTTLSDVDFCSAGFSRIRIHRFVPKRSQAVLRDLQTATDYVLILFAVNHLARSPPSVFFFQTSPADDDVYKRTLSRRRPVGLPLCECLVALTARVIRVTLYVLLFCYFIISALLIVVYRDTLYSDLCYILNWTQLTQISEVICPVSNAEPSVSAPQTVQKSPSYFAWLYNVIDGVALSLFDTSLDDNYNRGTSWVSGN